MLFDSWGAVRKRTFQNHAELSGEHFMIYYRFYRIYTLKKFDLKCKYSLGRESKALQYIFKCFHVKLPKPGYAHNDALGFKSARFFLTVTPETRKNKLLKILR
jgi:hypothetical protein